MTEPEMEIIIATVGNCGSGMGGSPHIGYAGMLLFIELLITRSTLASENPTGSYPSTRIPNTLPGRAAIRSSRPNEEVRGPRRHPEPSP